MAIPKKFQVRLAIAGPKPTLSKRDKEMRKKPQVDAFVRGIQNKRAADKAVYLAEVIEKAMGRCAPLIKTFGSVAGLDADKKGAYMARETPKALRACDCKVAQPDLFEYVMYAVFGVFDRSFTWIPVPADLNSGTVAADLVK